MHDETGDAVDREDLEQLGGSDHPAGRIELSRGQIGARVSALAGLTLGLVMVASPHTVTSIG